MFDDAIAALSTPPGEGGIGIIRLSGKGVIDTVQQIFLPATGQELSQRRGFTLTLGWILDRQGNKIDQVLVGIMRAPHSYTGEDVVEINCHGGSIPVRRCLQRCLEIGLRMADPGEFTKRAFLNGRLDLSQAEAVIDIIRAKTDRGLKLALLQLEGNMGCIGAIEDQLLQINALVEASMDFPEEVGDLDYDEIRSLLQRTLLDLNQVITAGIRNEVYREGINVVICGKPNVGKSSLLNALLKKDKAIVTDIPGTTRDVIEDYINVRDIPVKIIDTAGIRATEDVVETIGVEKSKKVMQQADLLVLILDGADGITGEDLDIYHNINRDRLIVFVNKEDLEEKKISPEELSTLFAGVRIIHGSAQTDMGFEELEAAVEEMVLIGALPCDGMEIMINLRQKEALQRCRAQIESALQHLGQVSDDCLSVDTWGALETLGEISGKTVKEEVLDRIFHNFCIGK
ncbi:MAG: tRNA uridine-5-carboxymethylaminomethyl(34) synthesis GTPase MnmE [Syntrophomonadaceae bacterium]|nr:tRNA uridine-5-carboxymethylaminomethyl(34) synthesis GTPase MnmE [Syntrophomonadaceae bacterium]